MDTAESIATGQPGTVRVLPDRPPADRARARERGSGGSRPTHPESDRVQPAPRRSVRPSSKTGSRSSCRWACTFCSLPSWSRRARQNPGRSTSPHPRTKTRGTTAPILRRRGRSATAQNSSSSCTRTRSLSPSGSASRCPSGCTRQPAPAAYSEEQQLHGGQAVTTWQYARTSQFWFESFQNWQSEFLAVAAIIGGSIYLRQRSSSQSKPVHAPNAQTGD